MKANKTTVLWWVIVLLAIFNIVTIATIILNNHQNEEEETESISIESDAKPISGKYFRHELGFDNEQMETFRESNRRFRQKANLIISEINNEKKIMFEELQKTAPDTTKLNMISINIGTLHTELKSATTQFYMDLSKICTPEQKKRMKEIFTPLFIDTPSKNGCNRCKHKNINSNN